MNSIGSDAYFRTGSFIPFMLNPDQKVIGTFIEIPCLTTLLTLLIDFKGVRE